MDKSNLEIRNKLKNEGITQWLLAEKMGIGEMTLLRKLRRELPKEEKQKIFEIINEIAKENSNKSF